MARHAVAVAVAASLGLLAIACGTSGGRPARRDDAGAATVALDAGPPAPRWAPAARDLAIAAGEVVIAKHQCTRCH